MAAFYIYLLSDSDFENLANTFRSILNCNITNQTKGQTEQLRYGQNFGGKYYLIEVCSVEFKIIKNAGEAFDEDYSQYGYYLLCNELETIKGTYFTGFIAYISELLRLKGIQNAVREL